MKISVEQADITQALAKAQNIVERRGKMAVLTNVLLETMNNKLKIFATDLEVSLTDEFKAQIHQPGKVVVNAKNLFEILKELPAGLVDFEKKDNNWLKMSQKRAVFNIVGLNPEEYPVFPTYSTKEFVQIDADVLSDMIEKTIYSISTDETRYHMNGVYFEKQLARDTDTYRMVSTDGHRLSLIDRTVKGGKHSPAAAGVIIPRKGLHEIHKLLENVQEAVDIAIEGSQLIVSHGSSVLMIRLIEGKYPNYQQLIPKSLKEELRVQRDALLSSLKRVSLLSNVKSKGITLNVTQGRMEISSNNPELGDAREEIEVDYKGKDLRVGFNAKYILDVLTSMHQDIIRMSLDDQLSPCVIKPDADDDYTCVVMPMRI